MKLKLEDVPKFTKSANYYVHVSWGMLHHTLERYENEHIAPLDLNPTFQRGHVWTEEQQIAYVEYKLSDGYGADIIYFNCKGWMGNWDGPFVIVDGLQRITAVRKFMTDKLPAFGYKLSTYEDDWKVKSGLDPRFEFHIHNLETMLEVYQWYLEINCKGTPHTDEELDKVRRMLMITKK